MICVRGIVLKLCLVFPLVAILLYLHCLMEFWMQSPSRWELFVIASIKASLVADMYMDVSMVTAGWKCVINVCIALFCAVLFTAI